MKSSPSLSSPAASSPPGLGTFAGVFTPSILTILGIILFLRLGYVVGQAGLGQALLIIGLANLISVLTSFSLAAIATNLKVKGGGDYYLISRTLGSEFGGALGTVLFLAQSVSIAFYCIGFGEAVWHILPRGNPFSSQIIAGLAVALLFVFAWLGADWATRLQFLIMGLLIAALGSFFVGGLSAWNPFLLELNWTPPANTPAFWSLFAIFFPAVTGFTQGVSMSGDLKDPGKSLPLGTFLAVGVSLGVYAAAAVLLAAGIPKAELAGDTMAMHRLAAVGWLIDAGVIAATLSSGLASFLGAPRILQALSRDRAFPFLAPFAVGHGPAQNPRRAVSLAAGIAFLTVGVGNLNLVAPIVSMFFLISYGLLNYATFYEARAASPSFRPRFTWFDARLSLAGCVACLGAMLAINMLAGLLAVSVMAALYYYLRATGGPARWADGRRSYHLHRLRDNVLAIAAEPEHPRDWRPYILAFSDDTYRRKQLLQFAAWIEGGSGLTTAVRMLVGPNQTAQHQLEAEAELRADITAGELTAFPLVITVPELSIGLHQVVQSFGIGPVRANTVLLNWIDQLPNGSHVREERWYGSLLQPALQLGRNVIVLDADEKEEWQALQALPPEQRRIDIWWGDDATGQLTLLLAYLMTRTPEWEPARLRVIAPSSDKKQHRTLTDLQHELDEARIAADIEIAVGASAKAVIQYSADAAFVFLPLRFVAQRPVDLFGNPLEELLPSLPVVALALAVEDIDLDAEPEEGKAGQLAVALDATADAEQSARQAEQEAARAAQQAERQLRRASAELPEDGATQSEELDAAALEAQQLAIRAAQRAERARDDAEEAARVAEELGALPSQKQRTAQETNQTDD